MQPSPREACLLETVDSGRRLRRPASPQMEDDVPCSTPVVKKTRRGRTVQPSPRFVDFQWLLRVFSIVLAGLFYLCKRESWCSTQINKDQSTFKFLFQMRGRQVNSVDLALFQSAGWRGVVNVCLLCGRFLSAGFLDILRSPCKSEFFQTFFRHLKNLLRFLKTQKSPEVFLDFFQTYFRHIQKTSTGFLDFFQTFFRHLKNLLRFFGLFSDLFRTNPKNLYRFLKTSRGFLDFFQTFFRHLKNLKRFLVFLEKNKIAIYYYLLYIGSSLISVSFIINI